MLRELDEELPRVDGAGMSGATVEKIPLVNVRAELGGRTRGVTD